MQFIPLRHILSSRTTRRLGFGFTLQELLTTLTVVAAMASLAAPPLQQLIAKNRQSTAMNTFIAALYTTRSEAMKRGARAVLCPSRNGRDCADSGNDETVWSEGYLVFVDQNGNHERDSDEEIVRVFDRVHGIRIRSSQYREYVSYQPNGLARGTNATFQFCSERSAIPIRSLVMSNTGRVRVAPPATTPSTCPM